MPALNEAQRQKQIAIAKQGKAKPKAKPGQKGQQTNNKSSRTKSETIGGAKPKAKASVPVTPEWKRDPEFRTTGGWVGDPNAGLTQPVQRRSPAIGAPVHASPSAFGSVARLAPSPYVGSSAASPARPSTPAQAVQQQPQAPAQAVQQQPQAPANPYAGIGDVRGQQLPQSPVQQDAELSAGSQQYGGQSVQGINENGVDMERRRAFLDANNSLDGLKAVKELLNRRKLSISVEN
jgi:hypothetical protein